MIVTIALVAGACSASGETATTLAPISTTAPSPAAPTTTGPATTTSITNTHPQAGALDAALQEWATTEAPMGVVGLISSDGQPIWVGTAGDDDAIPDGLFEIGSITKTLVAVTALRLAETGALDLDQPISEYSPDLAPAPSTTLRQLLSHTSGLTDPEIDTSFETLFDLTRIYTPDELVSQTIEAAAAPVAGRFRYANSGYWVAGSVISRAGGAPLETLIRDLVLDPVGMTDTFLAWVEPVPRPLVPGYVAFTAEGGELPLGTAVLPAMVTGAWSAGGVVSTVRDVAMFFSALFGGDLLNATSLESLLTTPDGSNYGLGIERRLADGNDAWGHNGAIPGYRSSAIYDPASGLTVVVLSNRLRPDADTEPLASRLLAVAAGR